MTSSHSSLTGQPHLSDYLRIVYKRRWTAIVAFLVVFVYGAISTLKKTPIYEASTQLQIEKGQQGPTTLNNVFDQQTGWYDDDFYSTQTAILRSRSLALTAIEQMKLPMPTNSASVQDESWSGKAIDWVKSAVGAPKEIAPPPADETTAQADQVSAFLGGLSVQPVKNTQLVAVSYRSPDPTFAARAANAVAVAYRDQGMQTRFNATKDTNDWLQKQLDDQKQKLDASEQALQDYKEKNDVVAYDGPQNPQLQQLAEADTMVMQAHKKVIDAEATWRNVQSQKDNYAALAALPQVQTNPLIPGLLAQKQTLENDRAEKLKTLLPGADPIVQIDKSLADVDAKLKLQFNAIVQGVEDDYNTAKAMESSLTTQRDQKRSSALNLDRKAIQYATLKRDADSNKALYDNLQQKVKETGVTNDYKVSNVRIVDAATVPRGPVLPNTSHDLLIAFLEGLVLAVGLVFGFEYLDSRIKTPDDIRDHLGLPFLGLVPTVAGVKGDEQTPLLTGGAPPAFAEAMRAIRTSVVFSSATDGTRSVVVTSTAPHEGKTLVSTNLASALAQAELKTLLIDGDMRRPRVHSVFGCDQEPGLSNVLVNTTQIATAIRKTESPFLSVLPAGHIPPNPAELLGSPRYQRLIDELGKEFDWIVVDAPPVMAVTDAAVVAHEASGVVFVIGAEMTPRRNAMTAVEQLLGSKARIIGAVLNRVNLQRHSYYYAPYHRKDYTRAYVRGQ